MTSGLFAPRTRHNRDHRCTNCEPHQSPQFYSAANKVADQRSGRQQQTCENAREKQIQANLGSFHQVFGPVETPAIDSHFLFHHSSAAEDTVCFASRIMSTTFCGALSNGVLSTPHNKIDNPIQFAKKCCHWRMKMKSSSSIKN